MRFFAWLVAGTPSVTNAAREVPIAMPFTVFVIFITDSFSFASCSRMPGLKPQSDPGDASQSSMLATAGRLQRDRAISTAGLPAVIPPPIVRLPGYGTRAASFAVIALAICDRRTLRQALRRSAPGDPHERPP